MKCNRNKYNAHRIRLEIYVAIWSVNCVPSCTICYNHYFPLNYLQLLTDIFMAELIHYINSSHVLKESRSIPLHTRLHQFNKVDH